MTKEDVLNIQREWANGIIKMGKLSNDRDELEIFTKEFLKKNYDFENQVLFNLETIWSRQSLILLEGVIENVKKT
jgi:hypothetical protein